MTLRTGIGAYDGLVALVPAVLEAIQFFTPKLRIMLDCFITSKADMRALSTITYLESLDMCVRSPPHYQDTHLLGTVQSVIANSTALRTLSLHFEFCYDHSVLSQYHRAEKESIETAYSFPPLQNLHLSCKSRGRFDLLFKDYELDALSILGRIQWSSIRNLSLSERMIMDFVQSRFDLPKLRSLSLSAYGPKPERVDVNVVQYEKEANTVSAVLSGKQLEEIELNGFTHNIKLETFATMKLRRLRLHMCEYFHPDSGEGRVCFLGAEDLSDLATRSPMITHLQLDVGDIIQVV